MTPSRHVVRPATLRVVIGAWAFAGALVGATVATSATLSWRAIAAVACCVVAGEALRITLPYRDGQVVTLGQSDAVVMAGMVLLPPAEVAIGAGIGALTWHVVTRLEPVKAAFNVAQYTASATCAALVYRALEAGPTSLSGLDGGGLMGPDVLLPYAVGAAVFLVVGTCLVGTVVATVIGQGLVATVWRLVPVSVVVTVGGACFGLLALGLIDHHAYLLPAVAVPLVFVLAASRRQVDAQLDRERSHALADVERRLASSASIGDIDQSLVAGIDQVVHAAAAVWRDGAWTAGAGTVPAPTGPTSTVLAGTGIPAGPADRTAMAVAFDDAIVVAWGGDLSWRAGAQEWVERLARSASEQAERTRTHAALLAERATLRSVVDGTSDGIYVLDRADRIVLVNPAMAGLVRADDEMLVGREVSAVFGNGDWTSIGVRDVERRAEGSVSVWRVSVAAVADTDVGPVRVGVVHDVSTERRVARMKDDMLAVVSHELRTPLTPIRAAARLLRARWDRVDPAARDRLLDQVADRAEHLTRLVEDLLLVAQLSGEDIQAPQPMIVVADVAAALRGDLIAPGDLRGGHRLVYEGPDRCTTATDPRTLRRIVGELVDNACKFSPVGSPVTVTLTVESAHLRISVTDCGRGIPAEHLERIFERFERVEDPLRMQTSGAGLGLYITKALAQILGGSLQVTSRVGVGTTMSLTLPRSATAEGVTGGAGDTAPSSVMG